MSAPDNAGTTCPDCFTVRSTSGECMCEFGSPGTLTKDPIATQLTRERARLKQMLAGDRDKEHDLPEPVWVNADALARFDWHTALIPELLRETRGQMIPLHAATTDDVKVATSKGEAPAPFRVDAVDTADELWAIIVEFVTEVAEHLHISPPQAAQHVWKHHGSTQGFPAGTDATEAYTLGWWVQRWLDRHNRNIVDLNHELWDQQEFTFAQLRHARARWLTDKPTQHQGRGEFCDVCGTTNGVDGQQVDTETGNYWVSQCKTCGHVAGTLKITKEGMTRVDSIDDDTQPTLLRLCPECVAGKHNNCDNTAWDNETDALAACECGHHGKAKK